MTKYISSKGACRVQAYHVDPDCSNIKAESVEVSQSQLEFHDLNPCRRCVENYEHTNTTIQDHKFSHLHK